MVKLSIPLDWLKYEIGPHNMWQYEDNRQLCEYIGGE